MGVLIERKEGGLRVLRITGMLSQSEWSAAQTAEAKDWGPTTRIKVLVIAEGFKGWERSADWNDMTFFDEHGDQIDKIAIVADPKWKEKLMMFAGAGLRPAAVKFFSLADLAHARAWLR